MSLRITSVFILALTGGVVLAQEKPAPNWSFLASGSGTTFYYDPDTARLQTPWIKIWTLMVPERMNKVPGVEPFGAQKVLTYIDCKAWSVAHKQIHVYADLYGNGELLNSVTREEKDLKFDDVVPASLIARLVSIVCGAIGFKG